MTRTNAHRNEQPVRKILVVDDMEANRAVLVRRLERYGYHVDSVDSGAAALQVIATSPPQLVLLDYMMPQMNGIEVLQELRLNPDTRDLPVIMVTARAESEATIEALGAGADDYVTKPVDFDVLRARIENHLSRKDHSSELKRANAALDDRVMQRAIALADLEVELQHEMDKRQELERRIGGVEEQAARTDPEPAPSQPAVPANLSQAISSIHTRFETVFATAVSGRPVNMAILAELRLMIDQLRIQVTPP